MNDRNDRNEFVARWGGHFHALMSAVFHTSVALFAAAFLGRLINAYDSELLLGVLWLSTGIAGLALSLRFAVSKVLGLTVPKRF